MKRILLSVVVLFLGSLTTYAACTGSTPNYSSTNDSTSLQSCFDMANHTGDTITVAAGTGHYAVQMNWNVPVNAVLIGAGNSSDGGGDLTTFVDDYVSTGSTFVFATSSSGTFRISGITFAGGLGISHNLGTIQMFGHAQTRIDHIHYNGYTYTGYYGDGKMLNVGGTIYGVLDHSILDLRGISWIHVTNGGTETPTPQGDAAWALATGFGGPDFFYIEDVIVNTEEGFTKHQGVLTDCHTGGKFVVRFSNLSASEPAGEHGTGHSSDDRGCRAHESYANLVTPVVDGLEPNFAFDATHSGGALVWNNEALNVFKNGIYFNTCRVNQGGSENCGYSQTAVPGGWGNCGTLHGPSVWDRNDDSTGRACIDQPGRGIGDLVTGTFPTKVNSTTGTATWNHEALEPIYTWMNNITLVGGWGGSDYSPQTSNIFAGQDYYVQASGIQTNNTTPFNGSSGTGWGTIANIPAHCTTGLESGGGTGYFATNVGSWNTSVSNAHGVQMNGADGVLYKCTATDTWTVYYTPYCYPHPLVSGVACTSATSTTTYGTRVLRKRPRFNFLHFLH